MLLETLALGHIKYEKEDIINFAHGIPGFESFHQYIVVQPVEDEPIAYLQSIDERRVHFAIINPFYIYKDYEFYIDSADQSELGIDSEKDVEVWSIITASEHVHETTMNLLAPIIINKRNMQGKQIILHNTSYRTKHKVSELMVAPSQSEGV